MDDNKKFKWKCLKCGSIQISDPLQRHQMDYCKCKESACDAEVGYCRMVGYYKYIGIVESSDMEE